MREAIGGTWLFQIVIFFVLLFAGFMCLTINQSKAFNVKDRIIQTIQSYNGIDLESECQDDGKGPLCEIKSYLIDSAYRTTGDCNSISENDGYSYVGFSKEGTKAQKNAAFCVAKIDSGGIGAYDDFASELPSVAYYRVVVFYQLDLPIFHDLFNFKIRGDTKTIYVNEGDENENVDW